HGGDVEDRDERDRGRDERNQAVNGDVLDGRDVVLDPVQRVARAACVVQRQREPLHVVEQTGTEAQREPLARIGPQERGRCALRVGEQCDRDHEQRAEGEDGDLGPEHRIRQQRSQPRRHRLRADPVVHRDRERERREQSEWRGEQSERKQRDDVPRVRPRLSQDEPVEVEIGVPRRRRAVLLPASPHGPPASRPPPPPPPARRSRAPPPPPPAPPPRTAPPPSPPPPPPPPPPPAAPGPHPPRAPPARPAPGPPPSRAGPAHRAPPPALRPSAAPRAPPPIRPRSPSPRRPATSRPPPPPRRAPRARAAP